MEYLMSYGWAVLLVLVVGVAMDTMGVFNTAGMFSMIPPTSKGFQDIKPLLATCRMGSGVSQFGGNSKGFSCQFVNEAGTEVKIPIVYGASNTNGVRIGINGHTCYWVDLYNTPKFTWCKSKWVQWRCNDDNFDCDFWFDLDTTPVGCSPVGMSEYNVPSDSSFMLSTYNSGIPLGPCDNIQPGQRYDVSVDISYNINIGGATSLKHNIGTVSLTAT
jgi:hypothetical protein